MNSLLWTDIFSCKTTNILRSMLELNMQNYIFVTGNFIPNKAKDLNWFCSSIGVPRCK